MSPQPSALKSLHVTRPIIDEAKVKRMRAAREDGLSWTLIGERFGLDGSTVKRAVEKSNTDTQQRGT